MIEQDKLLRDFVAEMKAVQGQQITIRLVGQADLLVGILGIMQMALRHPRLSESLSAKHFAQWARAIEERLGEFGPATKMICSMGWSPEYDRG